MEFLHELYQKLVEFIFLGAVAFAGVKLGIAQRKRKDAKLAAENAGTEEPKA